VRKIVSEVLSIIIDQIDILKKIQSSGEFKENYFELSKKNRKRKRIDSY